MADTEYGLRALAGECQRVMDAPAGAGNEELNRSAFRMGQLVAGEQLLEATAADALLGAAMFGNRRPWNESAQTIKSGLNTGMRSTPRVPSETARTALPGPGDPFWTQFNTADTEQPVDALRPYMDIKGAIRTTAELALIVEAPPLVAGHLFLDSIAWVAGAAGAYKSFFAVDIAASVATGQNWRGNKVKPQQVLYVAAEGRNGLYKRVEAWEKANHTTPQIDWLVQSVNAATAEWDSLIQHVAQNPYGLIVLDTQARMTVGMEENDAKDAGRFVQRLEMLREASAACVMPIHHMNRSATNLRGSTAFDGAATTIIELEKRDDTARVRCAKQKDAEPFMDYWVRPSPFGRSIVLVDCEKPVTWDAAAKRTRT